MGDYCSEVTDAVWSDRCCRDGGDDHTTLRMGPILFPYRFKRVERLTNLLSNILTHARMQPNFLQDTVDQRKVCDFDVSSLLTRLSIPSALLTIIKTHDE